MQPRATDSRLRAPATPLAPRLRLRARVRRASRLVRGAAVPRQPALILAGIVLLSARSSALIVLADRTSRLSPDFLTEVVLYALSVTNITMLVALVVRAGAQRHQVGDRAAARRCRSRASAPSWCCAARHDGDPAVLVLIVGSVLIRTRRSLVQRADGRDPLVGATASPATTTRSGSALVADQAARLARRLSRRGPGVGRHRRRCRRRDRAGSVAGPACSWCRCIRVRVRRRAPSSSWCPCVDVASPTMPQGWARASADRLAARVAAGGDATPWMLEPLAARRRADARRAAVRGADGQITGVVVASDYLSGDLAARSRRMTQAYEDYTQLRVLKQPLAGVYMSFFLMVTLLILVGSTWMGLYLAKRITRPVQMLPAAAKEIGAGHLDHRIEHETADEFGSLVEAFNSMAGGSGGEPARLERSPHRSRAQAPGRRGPAPLHRDDPRAHRDRRGLDRRAGRIGTINRRPRGCSASTRRRRPAGAADVFARGDLTPLAALLRSAASRAARPFAAGGRAGARRARASPGRRGDDARRRRRTASTAPCWWSTT